MSEMKAAPKVSQEQAEKHILLTDRKLGSHYGYDIYIPNIIGAFLISEGYDDQSRNSQLVNLLSPVFYNAAWELCRRGIIRPGVKEKQGQETEYVNGYSFTEIGREWIKLTKENEGYFIPTEINRFEQILAPHFKIFGNGFRQRAIEAVRCYNGLAYLSCCVMCGAATEAILLSLAVKKAGDEKTVYKKYNSTSGRKAIEGLVLKGVPEWLQKAFLKYIDLLKYWRDEAGHGEETEIKEDEAYLSLLQMVRFVKLSHDNYELLTAKTTN